MENKEYLHLDKKKIKEEDRRFLMSRNFNETVVSHQGSMHNTAITLSLLAILISTFSIVYLTKNLILIMIFVIFSLFELMFYIKKLRKVQENLHRERERMKKDYDELFKYHFAYAKNSKEAYQ